MAATNYWKRLAITNKMMTYHRSDLLSRSCFGTSRPLIVTKSKKMALFSQQITRKCLPLVAGARELNADVTWLTADGDSAAADRLRQSFQKRTSSSKKLTCLTLDEANYAKCVSGFKPFMETITAAKCRYNDIEVFSITFLHALLL